MGKDLTEVHSLQRKLAPDTVGSDTRKPTSLRGIADKAKSVCLAWKRVRPRNRMRENFTSGSVRGVPGNRHSYREPLLNSNFNVSTFLLIFLSLTISRFNLLSILLIVLFLTIPKNLPTSFNVTLRRCLIR